jgi:hypothetical protein
VLTETERGPQATEYAIPLLVDGEGAATPPSPAAPAAPQAGTNPG